MNYSKFVEENQQAFIAQGVLAQAQGAAKILDDPFISSLSKDEKLCISENLSDVANYLRQLCRDTDLSLPPALAEYCDDRMVFPPRPQALDPLKTVKVLIVDDELSVIINTLRSFIGWPNLHMSYYLFGESNDEMADAWRAMNDIIAINPDIVLMDQGLGTISGADLVQEIMKVSDSMIFVANTAADDDTEMIEAGCLPNCGKGIFPEGLRHALRLFMSR